MANGNITLQVRVPVDIALLVLGRLYGCGCLTREQYMSKVKKVSQEKYVKEAKNKQSLEALIDRCIEKRRKK